MTSDNKKPANRKRSWRCLARRLGHSLVPGVTSLILFLVVGAAGRLLAQDNQAPADLMDMSIEELMKVEVDSVYGASGYKQKVTEAPASVTIITADDIQRYGYRTLADVLRHVPGFYVSNDRNYSYVGVRGFSRPGDYNSRLLLLVDGHRVNDNVYDEAAIGTDFPMDIDLIDRVEVIRGPNSSLYVASAFLGVINIVTKRVRDAKGLTASGAVASYGTYTSRVTYGHQFESGLAMLLSGTYYDSHGQDRLYFKEFDTPGTNHGIAENRDGDQFHQVFSKLSYRDFTLEGVYGSRGKNVPTASFGTIFNDPAERTVDARGYLDLKYDHRFGSDWGYFGRLSYDHVTYNGFYPVDYSQSGGPARVLNRDIANGQSWGAEFALSKKLFENQTLVLGSDYRDNFQQDQSNYDVQPFKQYMNDHRTSTIWGIYAAGRDPPAQQSGSRPWPALRPVLHVRRHHQPARCLDLQPTGEDHDQVPLRPIVSGSERLRAVLLSARPGGEHTPQARNRQDHRTGCGTIHRQSFPTCGFRLLLPGPRINQPADRPRYRGTRV